VYLKYIDYVTIEKCEVSSEELRSDQVVNNAKIDELELMLKEMKKQLEKVAEEA
jgi:hypothetical protein